MLAIKLSDQRCQNCNKLLFKGVLGLGLVEVKCPRCGNISILHSFDELLVSNPDAYILVFEPGGRIVAASDSALRQLGYSTEELTSLTMQDLAGDHGYTPPEPVWDNPLLQTINQSAEDRMSKRTTRIKQYTKSGEQITADVRHYPIGAMSGFYYGAIVFPVEIVPTATSK